MDDIEVIQWLFDTETVTSGFNWPVNVVGLIDAKRGLDAALKGSPAEKVEAAYKAFAGAIGPSVMNALLESDDAFPEVNHSGKPTPPSPGKITLYVDPVGKRVLGEINLTWGHPATFSIE